MGLEGIGGGGDTNTLLAAPGLAQKLEDKGTNEDNANILNLFLDNVTVPGGAPAPITSNVGSIDVTASSIVFNGNFTRERYGRAAVQDPVTVDSDKLSLLTDDNMTPVDKTKSICGALQFDTAVDVLNLGGSSDFAGLSKPSDINDFSSRPDSMYVNAGKIPVGARDAVMAAFRGDAESEFINAMVSQVGGDTSTFTTFSGIVSDQPLMQSIATDNVAIGMLSAHPNGATAMAQSQTAMTEIAASKTAMQKVAASQTAMQEVAASQTAMQEVAASQTAINEIGSSANKSITENTVLNSSTATTEFQNSSLKENFVKEFFNANTQQGATITNSKVLVTSNNNSGDEGTGINFSNDVGPETQSGSTFITNEANVNAGSGRNEGSVGFNGIRI